MSSSATIVARLVHLSDLHFGLKDPQSVWDLLHKHVTSMAPAPTGVVVTGDIVNTPKEAHFKKAGICPAIVRGNSGIRLSRKP
jgi:3',5'-cyclic AMP phosphodiesterase CpdA